MKQMAKVFSVDADQAVCLPLGCEFDAQEVFIRKDPATGDVVLSRRPSDWLGFLEAVKNLDVPEDFLITEQRFS